ncbi:hypothetical protein C8R45DRAFT_1006963, partial [Mycena sanguinolenta]
MRGAKQPQPNPLAIPSPRSRYCRRARLLPPKALSLSFARARVIMAAPARQSVEFDDLLHRGRCTPSSHADCRCSCTRLECGGALAASSAVCAHARTALLCRVTESCVRLIQEPPTPTRVLPLPSRSTLLGVARNLQLQFKQLVIGVHVAPGVDDARGFL